MPWLIGFIVSWILFLLLVDWKTFKINVWAGVLAVLLATIVDWGGQVLNLYIFSELIIPWFRCSAFYKLGPIFTTGVLFSQYIPRRKSLQLINIFVISICYLSVESLILSTHVAQYLHWHTLASFLVNILTLTSITWFVESFLNKSHS